MPSLLTRIEGWEEIEEPMLHQAMGRDTIALAPQTTPLESDRWMVIVNVVILVGSLFPMRNASCGKLTFLSKVFDCTWCWDDTFVHGDQ